MLNWYTVVEINDSYKLCYRWWGIFAFAWALVFKLCKLVVKFVCKFSCNYTQNIREFAIDCGKFVPLCKHKDLMWKFCRNLLMNALQIDAVKVQWKYIYIAVIWLILHWFTVRIIPLQLIAGISCNYCNDMNVILFAEK